MPDGHVGPVRLVEIEGLDVNTCGGTHVARTSELQMITFDRLERVASGTRLHYLAGDRVRRGFSTRVAREAAMSRALSTGPETHVADVERVQAEAKRLGRQLRAAREEVASFVGASLASGPSVRVFVRRTEADLAFLNRIANTALAGNPTLLVVLLGAEKGARDGVFLVAGPSAAVAAIGPPLATLLGGRGGGRPGRYQGRASRLPAADEIEALLAGTG